MAEIINLRRARKSREREAAARLAEENRAKFGRTKAERETAAEKRARSYRTLDGAKRED